MKQVRLVVCTFLALNACLLSSARGEAPTAPASDRTSPYHHYYVAATDTQADDGNPGTLEAPFLTINGALKALADRIQPGDTIWVRKGTYRESVTLTSNERPTGDAVRIPSGTSYAEMIALAAYPGEKPVLKGSDVVTGWTRDKDDVWVKEGWSYRSQQVFANDQLLTQIGGDVGKGHVGNSWLSAYKDKTRADMFPGSFYHDVEAKKLYVWLPNGQDPNTALIEVDARPSIVRVENLEFIRISGLVLRHSSGPGNTSALSVHGRYCVVDHVDQAWGGFGGGFVGGEFQTFSHCKFNHNGNTGMNGRYRGHRILFNETSYNNYRNWSTSWHAGGVKFIPSCHDWVVRGHVASYNNGDGIWFDGWMSNITIEECSSFRNRGCGIHYEIGSRGVIKNNVIYENGMRGIYLSNSSFCLVANNLLYRNGMSGICSIVANRQDMGVFSRGPQNLIPGGNNVVVGNILVDNCNIPYLLDELPGWGLSPDMEKYFHAVMTNYITWTRRPELIMPGVEGEPDASWSDYNIFYRSGDRSNPDRLAFGRNWDITYARGLKDWHEKTGWDEHSIFAQPKFVDEAKRDFRPADDSPALWFAKKFDQGVMFDMDGGLRPNSYEKPATAGPYGGLPRQFQAAEQGAPADPFRFKLLDKMEGSHLVRLFSVAQTLAKELPSEYVSPIQQGIRVASLPFAMNDGAVFLSMTQAPPRERQSLSLGWTVQKLHLLLVGAPGEKQPFARIVIHRDDGVSTALDVSGDADETLSVSGPAGAVSLVPAWTGKTNYKKQNNWEQEQVRVFLLTWTNDNPWLPIRTVDFTLLDSKAELAVIGLTGESLAASE